MIHAAIGSLWIEFRDLPVLFQTGGPEQAMVLPCALSAFFT